MLRADVVLGQGAGRRPPRPLSAAQAVFREHTRPNRSQKARKKAAGDS